MVVRTDGPVERLLAQDRSKVEQVHTLGIGLQELELAMKGYRAAWKSARDGGWAKNDLVRAGFIDPARLPRSTARTMSEQARPSTDENASE